MEFNAEKYLSNLSYINKDFPSLWNEILETVPKLTNKWIPSEANESDPLVVLLKELAIIADKLNYNVDKNVLELFPATLTQLRSAYNVYESLGYTPDWYVSAVTSITISYTGMVGDATPNESDPNYTCLIPKFTQVSDDDTTIIYTLMQDVTREGETGFKLGQSDRISVLAMEGVLNNFEVNGSTQITYANLDSQNRLYFTQSNVAQNGIFISNNADFSDFIFNDNSADSEGWRRVDNLNQYVAGNYIYKLGIDTVNNSVYIQFPDDIGTLIGDGIYIKYILSSGAGGNIARGDITQFANVTEFECTPVDENTPTLTIDNFVVTNTQSVQSGADPLDIEEMREQFNRVVGVFDTLVTCRDYENYIYEATDDAGIPYVSNIRVSDRNTDLRDSIEYKMMTIEGDIIDEVYYVPNSAMEDAMSPYDLRLYPLPYVDPIETQSEFDNTFGIGSGDTTITNLNNTIQQEVIANAKVINHNFSSVGNPVIVNYQLSGQIYLQSAVSTVEASNIMTNVQSAVYGALNARELEWGSAVDYGNVVDTIKASDSRIQYVALDAITYDSVDFPSLLGDSGESFESELIERNILKGNRAWTEYAPFTYNYGEEQYKFGSDTNPNDFDSVTSVQPIITIDEPNTYYIVNQNETVTFLVPQYNVTTTYGNYLYFVAVAAGTVSDIPASVPYEIPGDCHIYFYTTRDAAEADIGLWRNADHTLEPGTIIKSSHEIEWKSSNGNITASDVNTMGSNISINVLSRASGALTSTSSIDRNNIYVCTNSQPLHDALATGESYTLLSGEYLFYTDASYLELGIISEGTTISSTTPGTNVDITVLDGTTTIATDLLSGSSSAMNKAVWSAVTSGTLKYELNELYTFGANYIIGCTSTEDTPVNSWVSSSENKVIPEFSPLPDDVSKVRYQLLDVDSDGVYSGFGDNRWSYLPSILKGDHYSSLIRLSMITGPGLPQTLTYVAASNFSRDGDVNPTVNNVYYTHQSIQINGTNESDSTPIAATSTSTTSVQTSMLVSYQGGLPLTLSGEDEQSIKFYAYKSNSAISYGVAGGTFVDAATLAAANFSDGNVPIPTNGDNSATVIAYISSSEPNTVQYLLARNSSNLVVSTSDNASTIAVDTATGSISDIAMVSRPYVTITNATYYPGNTTTPQSINDAFPDTGANMNIIKLGADQFYGVANYCPLYVPSGSNAIDNPVDAESFFLTQHPYNRFTLPRMSSMNNLTISPASLTR